LILTHDPTGLSNSWEVAAVQVQVQVLELVEVQDDEGMNQAATALPTRSSTIATRLSDNLLD
jgi:predicted transcriptional regulator